jgi:hypothetical protein
VRLEHRTIFARASALGLVGVELVWQGPSVALQITRGPEGLSKFCRSDNEARVNAVAAIDRPILQSKQQSARAIADRPTLTTIGWRGPSLRGGGSRQSYSAGLLLVGATLTTIGWRGPSLRGGGSRQSYSAGLLLVGAIESKALW